MKMNVFMEESVLTEERTEDENRLKTVGGHRAIDVFDPEAEFIEEIDKERYTPIQWKAKKFVEFLSNKRLNMEKLRQLGPEEQSKLRQEFTETFEA